MNPPPIVIAGAGIAGLAAALACHKHDCVVLEKAEAFSPVGAGLQLGPNAVRALQSLGAWDEVEPITSSPPAIHMREGISGKILKVLPLGRQFEQRHGAPYRVAHRADLHDALLRCVSRHSNIAIKLASTITSVDVQPDHVAVATAKETYKCQSLIAADGVNSRIRESVYAGAAAVDSGLEFHRAMLPATMATDVSQDCVTVWLYPHGHVVHYPVGKQQQLNIIAITPKGHSLGSHFAEACAPLKQILAEVQDSATLWAGLYAPPLGRWVKGGVLLLGDAAHGTLPFLAQGAAMALEDAACLAKVLQTARSLPHAFAEVSEQRIQRTTRLHETSIRAGRVYHATGSVRIARNMALAAAPPSFLTAGLRWIYDGN
jgi:salicylate hydroxylase